MDKVEKATIEYIENKIRRRGHFIIYDDGSVQSFLSYKLREQAKGEDK